MSKVIESPVKRWPGTVTIPDFLTFEQAIAFERADIERQKLYEPAIGEDGQEIKNEKGNILTRRREGITDAEFIQVNWPGILACVEAWNLENFDPGRLPATPRIAVYELVTWLTREISALYDEANEVPNE